jgi:hypothetical protein
MVLLLILNPLLVLIANLFLLLEQFLLRVRGLQLQVSLLPEALHFLIALRIQVRAVPFGLRLFILFRLSLGHQVLVVLLVELLLVKLPLLVTFQFLVSLHLLQLLLLGLLLQTGAVLDPTNFLQVSVSLVQALPLLVLEIVSVF